MQILSGKILDILTEEKPVEKKILILGLGDKQSAFVEFRGNIMMNLVKDFTIDETVHIAVAFNGSISKKSGLHFNNLIAKSIKKLNPNNN